MLGRHRGLAFYTIGQRKGLGLTSLEPLHVLKIDASQNALIVGPATGSGANQLYRREDALSQWRNTDRRLLRHRYVCATRHRK